MCGIAGYSLSTRSAVDRTLAAQSLLAGIAERGADAVGYAYRGPEDAYPVVAKQRTPAMGLRFADSKSEYRCLRLPPSGVPSAVIPLAPADEQSAPPPVIDLGAPPEPAQSEGDAPKKEY